MSDTYYWRRRKQVQGPFDAAKMKEFYDNGSLNATHEISADGMNWFPAGELIGAWGNEEAPYPGGGDSGAGGNAGGGGGDLQLAEDQWHFEHEGSAKGPVPFSQLQQLFAGGQLTAQTRVWKEGMAEWQPATNIPGLLIGQQIITGGEEEKPKKQPANPQIFAALGRSRPWATFLAIVLLIAGGLGVVGGLVIFIQGAKFEAPFLVGQGIGSMIGSGVTVTVAIILLSFSSLANTALIQKTDKTLIAALDGLRRYFMVLGMVVLLWLSMVLLLVIMSAALA